MDILLLIGVCMKKVGCDYHSEYEYYDIKDFKTCCTCKYFFDNELETRFECLAKKQSSNCYENKFED